MKTMKCKQLGGPESCNQKFQAETFEEIAEMSKKHGMQMFQKEDKDHLEGMKIMKEKMKNPEDFQNWYNQRKKEFEELPEN